MNTESIMKLVQQYADACVDCYKEYGTVDGYGEDQKGLIKKMIDVKMKVREAIIKKRNYDLSSLL